MEIADSLIPRSLVLTPQECFYCHNRDEDNLHWVEVDRMFGLKTCKDHVDRANRDCKAFMHKNKIVQIRDAIKDQNIKNLFDYLGSNIKVIRSNGNIDDGWKINIRNCDHIPYIKCYKGSWSIMLEKENGFDSIVKNVNIESFLNPELKYAEDNNFKILIEKAISSLDGGLYIEHFISQPKPNEYYDDDCIVNTVFKGRPVRMYIPQQSQ